MTPKPVTTVILTHSDGDHVNGLAAFPAGVNVIAHANNRKEQEAAIAGSQKSEKKPEPIRNRGDRVGRNDPCPCGSGKKYKNCHMKLAQPR